MKRVLTLCLGIALCSLIIPQPTLAYIDPGTGSFVLQIILAGIAGMLLGIKVMWGRIKSLFSGPSSNQQEKPKE